MTRPSHQKVTRQETGIPLHNRNRAATDTTHDLREHLDKKAGAARSIYGSKRHTPARDYGHQNKHTNQIPVRNKHQTQQQLTARHNMSRYRGATHPLCFIEEVLDHEFSQGFKPVNIEHTTERQTQGSGSRILSCIFTWLVGMTSTPSNTFPSN